MSKEPAGHCPGCNGRFAFQEYHWPHCPNNPEVIKRNEPYIYAGLVERFGIANLATITREGGAMAREVSRTRAPAKKKAKRP